MKSINDSAIVPLNMNKLRGLTRETFTAQEEVLDLFFLNISECLTVMEKSAQENIWINAIKEIQSLSNCIGAEQISKTCTLAQSISLSSIETRHKICTNIHANIEILKVFIRNTRY